MEAIINLKEATEIGEKPFNPILIAKKAEPQIADNNKSKKKLLIDWFKNKNYILFLGFGIVNVSESCINSSLLPSHK